MMTFILLVVFGAECPPQAPPINPRLTVGRCTLVAHRCKKAECVPLPVVKAKVADPPKSLCVCTDQGICECTGGECGCEDCPSKATPPKKFVTRTYQDGWAYERRCNGRGKCTWVKVPRMVTTTEEE